MLKQMNEEWSTQNINGTYDVMDELILYTLFFQRQKTGQ